MSAGLFRRRFRGIYTGREAKVGNLHERSLSSLAQNRLITQKQFWLNKVKEPFATFTVRYDLSFNVLTMLFCKL